MSGSSIFSWIGLRTDQGPKTPGRTHYGFRVVTGPAQHIAALDGGNDCIRQQIGISV